MPISAWGEARSRSGWSADLGLVWNVDLGLGWSLIWVSQFDWILDDFWLVLLVDWSGLIGLGDGFFELLDFELILEEE